MHTELEGRAPGEETPDTAARYVGFWERFLAFVVDSAWVSVIIGLVLAAAYGGNLTLTDSPLGGLRVILTLPLPD